MHYSCGQRWWLVEGHTSQPENRWGRASACPLPVPPWLMPGLHCCVDCTAAGAASDSEERLADEERQESGIVAGDEEEDEMSTDAEDVSD